MIKMLVICEDHTLDEHVIKPVVERIFAEHGRKCRVQVMSKPRIRGIAQALDPETMQQALDNYPMASLFLLIVDRDCDENREQGRFADRMQQAIEAAVPIFGCLAIEELEVWPLALHAGELKADWDDVRAHCDPKEEYFDPLVKSKGWSTSPGRGRSAAMREFSQRSGWDKLRNRCPEVQQLADDIGVWLDESGTF